MSQPLTLNLGDGSVTFSFTPQAAKDLKAAIAELMNRLKAVATRSISGGGQVSPQQSMEYTYTGDIFLEVFCNPNIWPSPFAAKVLIAIRDDRIRISTEVELTRMIEDLNQYLEQNS